MCGIVGFNWDDRALLKKMTDSIKNRGPDDVAYYNDYKVSLGMRRLSIIDLKKGIYPISNESGSILLIYNGEIYNFKEIREKLEKKGHRFKSDTDAEIIVHSYEEYGEKCITLFNGMFAFCLYDKIKKTLFIARDRIGIKPIYYYLKNNRFIFASEIKAILKDKEIKKDINRKALNQYISLRYIPGNKSIFEGIKKIPAGNYLTFDIKKKTIKIKKYWDLKNSSVKKSEDYFKKKIKYLLKDSIEKRLISDVPLGVYLSGGIDSSAIVGLLSNIKKENQDNAPIKTFSVGFEKGEEVNELKYAKEVSELFGTEHKEFIVKPDIVKILPKIAWHLDEPMADPALLPLYLLSEKAKKYVTVVLTGDGGDELFAGYDQYRFLMMANKLKHFPLTDKTSKLMGMIPSTILNRIYKHATSMGKESFKRVDNMINSLKENNQAKAYYELVSIFNDSERSKLMNQEFNGIDYNILNDKYFDKKTNFLNQLLYFDIKRLLANSFLIKTDRMTMAHSIEARVPLLDHRLVELSSKIPTKFKLKNNETKYIFKKAMSDTIQKNILYRKKQTFHMPIENWLDKDLKGYVENILLDQSSGYFNKDYIGKILNNYKKGKLFYARQIWNLICFEEWHKIFIKN